MNIQSFHVCFEVNSFAQALTFWRPLFEVAGFREIMTDGESYAGFQNGVATVWIGESAPRRVEKRAPTGQEFVVMDHLGFSVSNRSEVDAIDRAMRAAGFQPLFPAAVYAEFHPDFYAVTYCDTDNNVIEFGCRGQ